MLLRVSLLTVCLSGVAACSANNYCLTEQDYQKAEVVPEIKPVEGLAVPASPSALRLPDRPTTQVAFGYENKDGDGVCLDQPPAMPVIEKGVEVEGKGAAAKTPGAEVEVKP